MRKPTAPVRCDPSNLTYRAEHLSYYKRRYDRVLACASPTYAGPGLQPGVTFGSRYVTHPVWGRRKRPRHAGS